MFADGMYHDYAIVRDNAAGTAELFIDGVSFGNGNDNVPAGPIDVDPGGVLIGRRQSGGYDDILLLQNDGGPGDNHFEDALNNLALNAATEVFNGSGNVNNFMDEVAIADPTEDLIIIDNAAFVISDWTEVINFINAGGRAILSYWDLDAQPALAAALDTQVAASFATPEPVQNWTNLPLFDGVSDPITFADLFGDNGDQLHPIGSGVAAAGFAPSPDSDLGAIIVGNNNHTIVNGFLFDDGDLDPEMVQLASNQIQMLSGCPGSFVEALIDWPLEGELDSLRIWNEQRTALQLNDEINLGVTGGEPGLTTAYEFADTGAPHAFDLTPNMRHGVMGGSAFGNVSPTAIVQPLGPNDTFDIFLNGPPPGTFSYSARSSDSRVDASILGNQVIVTPDPGYVGTARITVEVQYVQESLYDPRGRTDEASFDITIDANAIYGNKFDDLNGNALRDAGETGDEGVQIFLDLNNNAQRDAGEPTTFSDQNGDYGLRGLELSFTASPAKPARLIGQFPVPVSGTLFGNTFLLTADFPAPIPLDLDLAYISIVDLVTELNNQIALVGADAAVTAIATGNHIGFETVATGSDQFIQITGGAGLLGFLWQFEARGSDANGRTNFTVAELPPDDTLALVETQIVTIEAPGPIFKDVDFANFKVVDAGPDQNVNEGQTVFASAVVTDPDTGNGSSFQYQWTVQGGNLGGTFFGPVSSSPDFSFDIDEDGTYVFTVLVDDIDAGDSYADTFSVFAQNVAPVAHIGGDRTVNEGTLVAFNNSFSDAGVDDTHTFLWQVAADNGQPVTDGTNPNFSFTPFDNGLYTVTFTVTDDEGDSDSQSIEVTVNNTPPIVTNIAGDLFVNESDMVALTGSFTEAGAADTHTLTWSVVADNGQVVPGGSGPNFNFAAIDNGAYSVTFAVTDDDGGGRDMTVDVIVSNVAPENVDAGPDLMVDEGDLISLAGAFTDPGVNDTHVRLWSVVSDNGQVIPDGSGDNFSFMPDDNGSYTVTYTVTDNAGDFTADQVIVTVNNVPPQDVDAGDDVTVLEGLPVSFVASFDDPGPADTHSILWTVKDALDQTVATSTDAVFMHTPADDGVFTVIFEVSDGDDTSSDQLTLTVDNVAPMNVNGGADVVVDEGQQVDLSVSFTEMAPADTHDILWQVVASNGQIVPDGSANVFSFTPTDDGIYTVTVTVTDDDGGATDDTIIVQVNNVAPVVTGPASQTIVLDDTANTAGSFTDPGSDNWFATIDYGDGVIVPLGLIGQTFTTNHVYDTPGVFNLTVTVTDDENAVGQSSFDITVVELYYGDAPDPTYPTLDISGGAFHTIQPGFHLGLSVDGDADGQPTATADIQVTVSAAGVLDAWLDFDNDGSWAQPGDRIFTATPLNAGVNLLSFPVPSGATLGGTFARFRLSQAGVISFDGDGGVGEVEDYQVTIVPSSGAVLPYLEDFNDNVANNLNVVAGNWQIAAGRYESSPAFVGQNTLSILQTLEPLPSDINIDATLNSPAGVGGLFSNGMIILDYQSAADFKYVGAFTGAGKFRFGEFSNGSFNNLQIITDAALVPDTDFDITVQVVGTQVTVLRDGVDIATHDFGELVTDGQVGLGTINAAASFDNLAVEARDASLPYLENFDDGAADHIDEIAGAWQVAAGRYEATPQFVGQNPVSVLVTEAPLPTAVEIDVTLNSPAGVGGLFSNALIILDYKNANNYRYVGAFTGAGKFRFGRSLNGVFTNELIINDGALAAGIDINVVISSTTATLSRDGNFIASHDFGNLLHDGQIGLGTRNATASFEDFSVQSAGPVPGAALPHADDFNDAADDFFVPRAGLWQATGGVYAGAAGAAGSHAISTLQTSQALPTDFEINVMLEGQAAAPGFFTNAVVVFDYVNANDFKWAGPNFGGDKWKVGSFNGAWVTLATFNEVLDVNTLYDVQVLIEGTQVTIKEHGATKITHDFGESLNTGAIGLGAQNASAEFDDLNVAELLGGGAVNGAAAGNTIDVAGSPARRPRAAMNTNLTDALAEAAAAADDRFGQANHLRPSAPND